MTQLEAFAKELENESTTTRKMLSIIPEEKFGWKPHEKSMTVKRLATHIAELPSWIGMALTTSELDFKENPYKVDDVNSTEELLAYFERTLEDGRRHLQAGKEESLSELWTLRNGETIYSTEPKWDVLRTTLSQIVHHRAQLGVFLRLLDVKLPGSYGPSADESF